MQQMRRRKASARSEAIHPLRSPTRAAHERWKTTGGRDWRRRGFPIGARQIVEFYVTEGDAVGGRPGEIVAAAADEIHAVDAGTTSRDAIEVVAHHAAGDFTGVRDAPAVAIEDPAAEHRLRRKFGCEAIDAAVDLRIDAKRDHASKTL